MKKSKNKNEFLKYIKEQVNPSRKEKGLIEMSIEEAEACFSIITKFSEKIKKEQKDD